MDLHLPLATQHRRSASTAGRHGTNKISSSAFGPQCPGDDERELLALPARLGGMGLVQPTSLGTEHEARTILCRPLADLIINQNNELEDAPEKQKELKKKIQREKQLRLSMEANALYARLPRELQRPVELACEKGASSWLTALQLTRRCGRRVRI